MRHFSVILLLACVLFISSCKKDDPIDLILGKWKVKSLVITQCTNPIENQSLVFSNGCLVQSGFTICQDINFNSDKTYTFTTVITGPSGVPETETEAGKYTITDDKITLCSGLNNTDCNAGTFSVTESTLSLNVVATDNTGCVTSAILTK